jgi:hypothetical protein
MRNTWAAAIVAISVCGCASSSRIERGAQRHESRAKQLEAKGDVNHATKERAAAFKQYEKANSRAGFEDVLPVVFY